jgi:hypothetical protein
VSVLQCMNAFAIDLMQTDFIFTSVNLLVLEMKLSPFVFILRLESLEGFTRRC